MVGLPREDAVGRQVVEADRAVVADAQLGEFPGDHIGPDGGDENALQFALPATQGPAHRKDALPRGGADERGLDKGVIGGVRAVELEVAEVYIAPTGWDGRVRLGNGQPVRHHEGHRDDFFEVRRIFLECRGQCGGIVPQSVRGDFVAGEFQRLVGDAQGSRHALLDRPRQAGHLQLRTFGALCVQAPHVESEQSPGQRDGGASDEQHALRECVTGERMLPGGKIGTLVRLVCGNF